MPLKLMILDVGVEAQGGSASVGGIARVRLIDTHRIPSGNVAVVTAKVRSLVETGLTMVFEQRNALITKPVHYFEDTLVDPDPDGTVCLVIHNSTGETKQLMSETALGVVEKCTEPESQYSGLGVPATEARINLVKDDVEARDQLVEKMNRTLHSMLAKHAHKFGPDWDLYLQQLLFAHRVKPQDSTGEAPFYLVYGQDARLPTESAFLNP